MNNYFPKMIQPITVNPNAVGKDYILVSTTLLTSPKEMNSNIIIHFLDTHADAIGHFERS